MLGSFAKSYLSSFAINELAGASYVQDMLIGRYTDTLSGYRVKIPSARLAKSQASVSGSVDLSNLLENVLKGPLSATNTML